MLMKRTPRRLAVALVAVVALFSVGCGQGTGVVTGKVTLDGKPLPRGLITFLSEVGKKDAFSAAIIDGEYRTDPIPCGPAKVTVIATDGPPTEEKGGSDLQAGPRPGTKTMVVIPDRYQKPDTSGFELTIKPGENPFNADMTR